MTDQQDPGAASPGGPSRRPRPAGNGLYLGRPLGVPVHLGPSTVVLLALVTVVGSQSAERNLPGLRSGATLWYGVVFAALVLVSLLAHELAHCLVARGLGLPVLGIQFEGVGGVSSFGRATPLPGHEFLIAVAGPLANLALGVVAALGARQYDGGVPDVLLKEIGFANMALAVFNLLPGLPLDGGRLVMAAFWKARGTRAKGMRVAAYLGLGVAVAIGVSGVLGVLSGDSWSLYTLLVAFVLFTGARQATRAAAVSTTVPELVAGQLARPYFEADSDLPLAEALRRAQESGALAVVLSGPGGPAALMSGPAVDAVPEQRRPWVPLSSVCRTITPDLVVPAEASGEELLEALRRQPATEYLVVDAQGRPVGVLAVVDLAARLARASR